MRPISCARANSSASTPHRRHRLGAPPVAADRAAIRLAHRDRGLPRRVAAGGRLRTVSRRHGGIERGVRARRTHLPAPVRLDPRPIGHGDPRRCRQPRRGRHPGPGTEPRFAGIENSTNTVIVATDDTGDEIFLDSSGFLTPSTLLHGTADGEVTAIKRAPSFFDPTDMEVTQHFATSDDGTRIPYFVVGQNGSGPAPTLSAATADSRSHRLRVMGVCWAGCGSPVAVPMCWPISAAAAVRTRLAHPGDAGGPAQGRRGLRWWWRAISSPAASPHRRSWGAGRQQRRPADGHHADQVPGVVRGVGMPGATAGYEAFPPVARRSVLGGRYGDPDDPDDWAFISEYSLVPEHQRRSVIPVLITTSTRDDRVHPGMHAR